MSTPISFVQQASLEASTPSPAVTLPSVGVGSMLVAVTHSLDLAANPPPTPNTITDDKGDSWVKLVLCDGRYGTLHGWQTLHYCLAAVGGSTLITFNANTNTDIILAAEFAVESPLTFFGQAKQENGWPGPGGVDVAMQLPQMICPSFPVLLFTALGSNGGGQVPPLGWSALPAVGGAPNVRAAYRIVTGGTQGITWASLSGTGPLNIAAWTLGAASFITQKPVGGRGASW